MNQNLKEDMTVEPVILFRNWEDYKTINVVAERGGHGGGDKRLHDRIFVNPNEADPLKHAAGVRDGVMSVLIGIAARKSIETGRPIKINSLTDLKPTPDRT
jgi:hypothetical protein